MARTPQQNSRIRTVIFVLLVALILVFGWVALVGDGGFGRDADLVPPPDDDDALLSDTAEELPPSDDDAVLDATQDVGPEAGELVEDAAEPAGVTDPPLENAVEDLVDPEGDLDAAEPMDE